MDPAEIEKRFTYHAPDSDKIVRHQQVRDLGRTMAEAIDAAVLDGREKSLAMTALEEVIMWANAGIARA